MEKGTVGLITNGAGLGLATLDNIDALGGGVSGFQNVGGVAFHEQIYFLIEIMCSDDQTKVLFVNCAGGMKDMESLAIIFADACKFGLNNNKPIIIRLKGRSDALAYERLRSFNSSQPKPVFLIEDDFNKACALAVDMANELNFY